MSWREKRARIADGTNISWYCEAVPLQERVGSSPVAVIASDPEALRKTFDASYGSEGDVVAV